LKPADRVLNQEETNNTARLGEASQVRFRKACYPCWESNPSGGKSKSEPLSCQDPGRQGVLP